LDYNRKRQIKRAASEFIIRPVEDLEEFKTQGYAAYLSFYQRSRYSYGSRRRHQSYFCLWAEDLFEMPKANVLGAYRNGQLRGVSVSFLVEHTLFYATFFCDTPSLKLFLSDLMLHAIREEASHLPGIKQVFAGMYKGGCGLDDFYLLRGCTLIRKPAFLRTNPISTLILRRYLPQQHAKLLGRMGRGDGTLDAPRRPVASPSGNSAQPGQKASDKMAY
jgi:hypothetical protein